MASDEFPAFEYLGFAKKHLGGARFSLCHSGVAEVGIADVRPRGEDETRIEASSLGSVLDRWRDRVCARYDVPRDQAFPAFGTSGAVFVALVAISSKMPRGAAVAVERPAYGVFETTARLLGREVVHVERREEHGWAIDLGAVEGAFRAGARVYCLTDLHNPTGAAVSGAELAGLRDLARRFDAWILLDEVYRDFRAGPAGTGYRDGERVVCTSSLTKCYGLGGLRAGWIFAPSALVERAEQVADIAYGDPPAATIHLAAQALARADELLARGRSFAEAGRPIVDAWIAATPRASWVPPAAGITGLLRIDGLTDSMRFAERLREELDLQVVPGVFFAAEGHIRVSFGRSPKDVAAALDVLTLGIDPLCC